MVEFLVWFLFFFVFVAIPLVLLAQVGDILIKAYRRKRR
jgi:hypothetical protein